MSAPLTTSEGRFLRPICFVLRWLCLAIAALTVIGVVAVTVGSVLLHSFADVRTAPTSAVEGASDRFPFSVAIFVRPSTQGDATASVTQSVDAVYRTKVGGGLIAAAIGLGVALVALVWGLWHGSLLFKRLAAGEYFVRRTVTALRNFAVGLLLYKSLPIVALPLASMYFVHVGAPDSGSAFSYTFNPFKLDSALTIIFLGMIAVFAQVMTRAVEIAEDHAQIV